MCWWEQQQDWPMGLIVLGAAWKHLVPCSGSTCCFCLFRVTVFLESVLEPCVSLVICAFALVILSFFLIFIFYK